METINLFLGDLKLLAVLMDLQEKSCFVVPMSIIMLGRCYTHLKILLQSWSSFHIREDQGTENYDVAWYILSHPLRRPDRGSSIAWKSCHN